MKMTTARSGQSLPETPAGRFFRNYSVICALSGLVLTSTFAAGAPDSMIRTNSISNGAEWENDLPVRLPNARQVDVENIFIFRPRNQWTYAHHPHLAFFQGRFYAIWSNGRRHEDNPGQRVLISSAENFEDWTPPHPLVDTVRDANGVEQVLTAAGFYQRDGLLVAYVASYGPKPDKENRFVEALTTTDGQNWSEPRSLGLPLCPNHGPERTRSGRLIISGGIAYPWSDDPSGLSGWHMAGVYPPATAARIKTDLASFRDSSSSENVRGGVGEGSFFQTDDGVIYMLLRSHSHRLWLTESSDNGLTWSAPRPSEFSNANSKFHFGRLPDGGFYWVGNPLTKRTPLVLSLSRDGVHFDRHYILAEAHRELPRFDDEYGYPAYPHSIVHDGFLYVIVSREKSKIEVLRVALSKLRYPY